MADKAFEKELKHKVTIKKRTYNSGAKNAWNVASETITTSTTIAACLIQPLRDTMEIEVKGKKFIIISIGVFKITENINVDDIVIFNERNYIVRGVEDAAGQGHHIEVLLGNMDN